ncbi:MAG: hypothetical protein Q7Q73_16650 [Verrucomicrobiota bacterium JB024]|nr:hypothetical protein [Verrucomicrobiota bacterium JB024]
MSDFKRYTPDPDFLEPPPVRLLNFGMVAVVFVIIGLIIPTVSDDWGRSATLARGRLALIGCACGVAVVARLWQRRSLLRVAWFFLLSSPLFPGLMYGWLRHLSRQEWFWLTKIFFWVDG